MVPGQFQPLSAIPNPAPQQKQILDRFQQVNGCHPGPGSSFRSVQGSRGAPRRTQTQSGTWSQTRTPRKPKLNPQRPQT